MTERMLGHFCKLNIEYGESIFTEGNSRIRDAGFRVAYQSRR
jgi:hypothetical protein